jgi:activator of HSP90 ATPase
VWVCYDKENHGKTALLKDLTMSETIHLSIIIKATPHEIYEALMDSEKHSAFTRSKAIISREVGGTNTAYDNYIAGRNVALTIDRKIVQDWRAVDWPEGHFSLVTFELSPIPEGTRIDFIQSNLPEGTEDEFTQGWTENYWEPMKAYFEKNQEQV